MAQSNDTLVVNAAAQAATGILASTIPFYTKHNGVVFVCGSGVLIEIGDKQFVVTTAHLFDACETEHLVLCVPSGLEGKALIPFDKVRYHRPDTRDPFYRTDEPFDFCVCELPDKMVEPLRQCKRFVRLDQIDPFDTQDANAWYMVLGFPGEINPTDMANRRLKSDALVCCSRPYRDERGVVDQYDPRIHFQMHYDETLCTDGSGNPQRLPHPGGMSGCGIWRILSANAQSWNPTDVKLVAIQHSLHPQKAIQGTWVRNPLRLIWQQHQDLRQVFDFHYGSPWCDFMAETGLIGIT